MAITYVGGQVAGRTNPTAAIQVTFALTGGSDATPAANDLVIVCAVTGSAAGNPAMAVTTPTGYTALGQLNQSAVTADTSMDVSYKFMTSTPDANVTIPGTGNNAFAEAYSIQVFRGVDLTTPMDVTAVSAGGTGTGRPDPASITPVTTGAWPVICGGGAAGTGANYTAPTNYTTNFVTASGADTTDAMVGSGYRSDWSSGAEDPAAYTGGTTGAQDSWTAYTLALRPAVAEALTPSTARSEMLTSVITASWAAVVAVPLFASVLLQGAAPAAATPPPPRDDIPQYTIHQHWTPPPWETQVTRKVPTSGPVVAVPVPYSRASSQPILYWPPPDWPSQESRQQVQEPIQKIVPYAEAASAPIALWPQPEWPSQRTRNTVIPDAPVVSSVPYSEAAFAPIGLWVPLEWPTQTTRHTPLASAAVVSQTPFSTAASLPISQWPPQSWESQTTRKTVIPDVHDAPPPSSDSAFPISQWPPATWDAQTTRKAPIPDVSVAPAVLLSRASSGPILLWPQPAWEVPSNEKVVQPGPTIVSTPLSKVAQQPIALWPPAEWPTQVTRKTPIPDAVISAIPPFSRASSLPIGQWTPLDWPTQTTEKTVIPNAPLTTYSRAAALPIAVWPQPDWETQRTRKTGIPDAIKTPYSRAEAFPITLWPQPDWPAQTTRKLGQEGPLYPVGEPYWRADVAGHETTFDAKERVLQFPAKSRRFILDN